MGNELHNEEMEELHRIAVAGAKVPPRYFLWRNPFEARGEAPARLLAAADAWVDGYEPGKAQGWALANKTVGCGKSHLAAYMAQGVLRRFPWGSDPRVRVRWQNVPDLFMRIRATYDPERAVESEREVVVDMTEPDLLILDDMGVERPKVWVLEILYSILNDRGNRNKTTCFTSNYTAKALEKRLAFGSDGKDGDPDLAARIMSRMCDNLMRWPAEFPNVDYRKAKRGT